MRNSSSLWKATCSAAFALSALVISNPATAAGITAKTLSSPINVGGIDYIVTFNQDSNGTTYDSIFGPTESVGETAPTFKDQVHLAREARDEIVALLNQIGNSTTDIVDDTSLAFPESLPGTSGNFIVPFAVSTNQYNGPLGLFDLTSKDFVANLQPPNLSRLNPATTVLSIATFEAIPTAVPTPALLPGLIGFGASILRKRKQAAS